MYDEVRKSSARTQTGKNCPKDGHAYPSIHRQIVYKCGYIQNAICFSLLFLAISGGGEGGVPRYLGGGAMY